MYKNTLQIFQTLEGQWRIERSLDNKGSATGIASFTIGDNPHHLNYTEKAKLQLQGQEVLHEAYQKYIFIYNQGKNTIEQFTEATKLMYELKVEFNLASGEYLCGSDIYSVNYHFINDHRFTIRYIVKGPQKNYMIFTEFEKIELLGGDQLKAEYERDDFN